MKERILNLLCRKVRLFDENYTFGGIVIAVVGTLAFVMLCGLAESLAG